MKTRARARSDEVERDFLSAIDRLIKHKPRNMGLKRKIVRGTFKFSFSAVAMEAGHSRTLIALENCAYPVVRRRIIELMAPVGTSMSLTSVNFGLRARNKELERKLKFQVHELANHIAARHAAERRLARYIQSARQRDGLRIVSDITLDSDSNS